MSVEADILEVFYQDQQTPVELGETKDEAVTLDGQRFPLFPRLSATVEESKDPSDGSIYQLRLEMLIDNSVMKGQTNWIPNEDENRIRVFSLEVDKHPVKLMQREKVHSVRFRLSHRRLVFGVPLPIVTSWEEMAESEPLYYKIARTPPE